MTDREFSLKVFDAKVAAEATLLRARSEYTQTMMQVLSERVRIEGNAVRLRQLRQSIREFNVEFQKRKRELKLAEASAKRVSRAVSSASRLLTGDVPAPLKSVVFASLFQIVNLCDPDAQVAILKVVLANGVPVISHLREHRSVPAPGDETWTALCEVFKAIDSASTVHLAIVNAKVETENQAIDNLRQRRWDAVKGVGKESEQ